jgi:two-component sensor histidine kinase
MNNNHPMRIIIYVFFLFIFFQIHSQIINVDSLTTQMKSGKLSPEGQHKLYAQLYNDYFFKDELKAIRYNAILYNIAKKYNLKSGIGDYYLNKAFYKYSHSDFVSALHYSNKASKMFLDDKNIDSYLFSIARQCLYLKALDRVDESFQLAIKNISLYKDSSNSAGLGEVYLHLADYYYDKKTYNFSISNAKAALIIFQKVKYYHGIAECDALIGDVLYKLEKYSESIIYFKKLIELPKELKNNEVYHIVYYTFMAKNYIKLNRYKEAIQLANKAIREFRKSYFGLILIDIKLSKADAYQKSGNNTVALKIIRIIEKEILNYLSEPEIDKSLKYINTIKSNVYLDYKQYNLALELQQKKLKFKDVDINTYQEISIIQLKLNRYKEAIENLQLYKNKKIEQLALNQKNNLDELQVLYNVKENEFKIQNLKIKTLKDVLELKKQKEFLRNSIVISVILVVVMIFGFYIYRIRIKVSQILKYKNEKLEINNEMLNKSLREKELLLKEIHHRVKNNLQLVSSILDIQANESPNISVSEFLDKSQNRISSIALIHQNLYMSENLDKVDFQTYTDELISCILDSFSEIGTIKYEIVANENCFNIQTSISLGLIISELSCNTIKHAFKDNNEGMIYIEIKQLENCKFELIFGDNGSGGIDTSETSKSIGLELVGLLAMQLNGDIVKLDKKGTFYKVTFEEVSY